MSKRVRSNVMLVVAALLGGLYGWLSLAWNDAAFCGGAAVLIALIGGVGLPWIESAADGAFRRRAQS